MTIRGTKVATKQATATATERARRGAASTPRAAGTNATPATGHPHTNPTAAHPMTEVVDPSGCSQDADAAVRHTMTKEEGRRAGVAAKRPAHGSASARDASAVRWPQAAPAAVISAASAAADAAAKAARVA